MIQSNSDNLSRAIFQLSKLNRKPDTIYFIDIKLLKLFTES